MSIINLQNVMPAQELLKKWRRNKDWLETFIIEGRITAYTFKGRDSQGVHVDDYYHGGYLWQDNVAIVFDPGEIERIEREHPEVVASPSPLSPALAPPKAAWPAPKTPPLPSHSPAGPSPSQALAEAQGRIAELERKLDEARRREEVLMARVAKPETDQGTSRATIGKLKKQVQTLAAGYEGAAKLACEIRRLGPRTSGNPWSEDEILALADELSVSIKGDCLKAFKAGMPDDLVKKSPGARPTTPHDESPDNEGS